MSVCVCVCVYVYVYVCERERRVYKNKQKLMNQLGHWNGHWDCGTDKEKLQVALFSTKLFTEESDFFLFLFF